MLDNQAHTITLYWFVCHMLIRSVGLFQTKAEETKSLVFVFIFVLEHEQPISSQLTMQLQKILAFQGALLMRSKQTNDARSIAKKHILRHTLNK